MRYVIVLFFIAFLAGCKNDSSEAQPIVTSLKINMSLKGVYKFERYIYSLDVYAFSKRNDGEYLYYNTLAELNQSDINKLGAGIPTGGSQTNSKLLEADLPIGSYRLYFVANTKPEIKNGLRQGVTLPTDVYMPYPNDRVFSSYFLEQVDVIVGSDDISVPVVLHRLMGRLFLELRGIPSQIDTVRLAVTNITDKIYLDGSLSEDQITVTDIFKVKNENITDRTTAVFDLYTYPTIGTDSDINLIFISKSGIVKTVKLTNSVLRSDDYLQLTAEINPGAGSLLSYEVSVIFFSTHNWNEVELPDFPLNPVSR